MHVLDNITPPSPLVDSRYYFIDGLIGFIGYYVGNSKQNKLNL